MPLTLQALLAGMLIGYGVGLVMGWIAGNTSVVTFKHVVIWMFICLGVALAGTIYL